MIPSDVGSIALETRKYFDDVAKAKRCRPTLKGLCSRASTYLKNKLVAAGHNARIQIGLMVDRMGFPAHHTWVVYDNQVIIDLTATQFGYTDKVLVCPVNDKRYVCI